MVYSFSIHPIWNIFEQLGLPPEIINKIFYYNTFFSVYNKTSPEIILFEKEYNFVVRTRSFYKNDMIYLINNLFFNFTIRHISNNSSTRNYINNFAYTYFKKYYYSADDIFDFFVAYIQSIDSNIDINIIKNKPNIFRIAKETLKHFLTWRYNKNLQFMLNLYKYRKNWSYTVYKNMYKNKMIFLENKLDMKYFWKNIIYVTQNNDENIDIEIIILYNIIYAIPFKPYWSKKKLIHNLIKHEPANNSIVYDNIKKDNLFIKKLYNYIKSKPFSSINTDNSELFKHLKGIDL